MEKLKEWYKQQHKKTLRECSCDGRNDEYMTESDIQVIDFDDVKDDFCKSSLIKSLRSVDSLYFNEADDILYLIEFKNGRLGRDDTSYYRNHNSDIGLIKEKIYDSVLLLKKEMGFNLEHSRLIYILVYNEEKNKLDASSYRGAVHVGKLAKKEVVRFGMSKFQNYLFKEVHTLTESTFEQQYIRQWG